MEAIQQRMQQQNNDVQKILTYTYGLVPIVAGLDKFTNLLTNWKDYLGQSFTSMLPFSTGTFMHIMGVIEIVAGVLVFVRPKTGAYIVMSWLIAIALMLIVSGHFFDVAVRDLVMAAGALVLAKLSFTNSNATGIA